MLLLIYHHGETKIKVDENLYDFIQLRENMHDNPVYFYLTWMISFPYIDMAIYDVCRIYYSFSRP